MWDLAESEPYQDCIEVRRGIRKSESQVEQVGGCCLHLGVVIPKTCKGISEHRAIIGKLMI